jgi:hypothetical protein
LLSIISLARSLLTKIKNKKWVGKHTQAFSKSVVITPWRSVNPMGYTRPQRPPVWSCASIEVTNHTFDGLRLLRAGLSLLTSLSDIALAKSDHGRASGPAVRFQDLFLAFS